MPECLQRHMADGRSSPEGLGGGGGAAGGAILPGHHGKTVMASHYDAQAARSMPDGAQRHKQRTGRYDAVCSASLVVVLQSMPENEPGHSANMSSTMFRHTRT